MKESWQAGLFSKTYTEATDTMTEIINGAFPVSKLFFNVTVSDNRSCNQLRKQCYVCCNAAWIFGCTHVAAVYINRITHRLKGIKADPDRQSNMKKRRRSRKQ